MKRHIIILFALMLVTTIYGCTDILNQAPQGQLTTETLFETPDDAYQAVIAMYHISQRSSRYTLNMWVFGDIASDDARKGGESGADFGDILKISYFTVNPSNSLLGPVWEYSYQGIHRANLIIENVSEIEDLDKKTASRYIAEAKFFRAFFYFRLAKIFGGVPLITKANLESYKVPRSSLEATYNLIEKDLKSAVKVLPAKSQLPKDELGRATKGTAQALLTRIYLMQGNFKKTEKWAKKIIDSGEYSLFTDYRKIFEVEGEHGPGIIFSINYGYNSLYQYEDFGNQADIYMGSRAFYGYGFNLPTEDLHDAFAPKDPRLDATMFWNGDTLPDGRIGDVGNSVTGYVSEKAYLSEDVLPPNNYDSPRDHTIFRYGHILLWYAEAANENGHTQAALWALNKVRERARQGNPNILPDITTTNQAELRKIIWHEERVEYAMEGKRFFDLVRTSRAAKVLHNFAEEYNTTKGAGFTKGVNNVFPIPESQIELSGGTLEQNPGY